MAMLKLITILNEFAAAESSDDDFRSQLKYLLMQQFIELGKQAQKKDGWFFLPRTFFNPVFQLMKHFESQMQKPFPPGMINKLMIELEKEQFIERIDRQFFVNPKFLK